MDIIIKMTVSIDYAKLILTLVKIFGNSGVRPRDLHEFLEVGRDFSNWFKDRVEKYGFEEGEDFSPILANSIESIGRPKKEYIIKMDMAKELAMVENNEKGRQARKYFIKCEKKLKETIKVPTTFKDAFKVSVRTTRKIRKTTVNNTRKVKNNKRKSRSNRQINRRLRFNNIKKICNRLCRKKKRIRFCVERQR